MTKVTALASALHKSGASVAGDSVVGDEIVPVAPAPVEHKVRQPSRLGTVPVTVHMPKEVRRQLKFIALEQDRHLEDVVAEAFNLVFAKYRKGEIAPVRGLKTLGA